MAQCLDVTTNSVPLKRYIKLLIQPYENLDCIKHQHKTQKEEEENKQRTWNALVNLRRNAPTI